MTNYRQTNTGGVNGATVVAAAGGSADGSTPYDAVGTGTGTTLVFDNTHILTGAGPMAVKVATSTSAVLACAEWTTGVTYATPYFVSACFYFTAVPTSQARLLTILTGTPTLQCGINVTVTTGTLQIIDGTGATNLTSTIPLNQWFRVELQLIASSATVGQVEARFFSNALSSTPDETKTTSANRNTVGGSPAQVRYGQGVGAANIVAYWLTQAQASTTAYPPPPLLSLNDSGTAADTATVTAAVPLSNVATAADTLTVSTGGGTPVTLGDTGTVADQLSVVYPLSVGDHATAADGFVAGLVAADAGTGADSLAVIADVAQLSDSATAADGLTASHVSTDAAAAVDRLSITSVQIVPHGLTAAMPLVSALTAATPKTSGRLRVAVLTSGATAARTLVSGRTGVTSL